MIEFGDCGHRSAVDPSLVCGLDKHPWTIHYWYYTEPRS